MIFTDEQLVFAARDRCPCGEGMAYPRGDGADAWDCAGILTGRATPSGAPGSVTHSARLPFAIWRVVPEVAGSGSTTRRRT